MNNEAIARRFYRQAALMEIRGEDPFRLRSYRNAAEAIETWPTPLQEIVEKEGIAGLQTIPGVGKAIAGKIVELFGHGTFDAWEKLTAETPATVLDLLRSPASAQRPRRRFIKSSKSLRLLTSRSLLPPVGWRWLTASAQRRRKRSKKACVDRLQAVQSSGFILTP